MEIIVYSKPDCGACDLTKGWLAQHDVPFIAIDAYENKQAMALIQEKGFMGFPVVNVDNWERSWSGFDYQNLEELV